MCGRVAEELQQNANLLTLSTDEVEVILSGCQPDQKRLADLFAVLYRRLAPKVGGDPDAIGHWLRTQNRHLGAPPLELLKDTEGFYAVLKYLDAIDSSR